ncbi:hypothetical protein ACM66B_004681 [Microbotryomycetes sp. NB124-2]
MAPMSNRTTLTRALEMQERDKDQLEIIALQREALASATELVAALQRRLRLMESTSRPLTATLNRPSAVTNTSPNTTLSTSPSPSAPPASTSLSAALRLQILGRGLQQQTLARRVEQAESRSQSRHATPRVGMSPVTSDVEDDDDDDDDEDESDEEEQTELWNRSAVTGGGVGVQQTTTTTEETTVREQDYRLWIAQQKLAKGIVDENGVRTKSRRTLKRRYSAGR